MTKKQNLVRGSCILATSLVAFGTLSLCTYGIWLQKEDVMFPGVTIGGTDVGGMTKKQAMEAVAPMAVQDITIHLPDRQWVLSGEKLAVSVDLYQAADQGWQLGRDGNLFEAIGNRWGKAAFPDVDLTPYRTWDSAYLAQSLHALEKQVSGQGADNHYTLSADGTSLVIQVGSPSLYLDVEDLRRQVETLLIDGQETELHFDYTVEPWKPVDLDQVYQEVACDPVDATYDETTKSVLAPVPGIDFDLESAKDKQSSALEGSMITIPLTKIPAARSVDDVESQLFSTVLGSYSDSYAWNPGRTTNLQLSADAIHGTILNPGEEFSFNGIVGERTAEKGYQAAAIYVDGNTVPELGGGVCQVASTIYAATLLADLKVTERLEHMFLVTYVPKGMDAAIYWDGDLDYKFVNNTDYPIRVDTWLENDKIFVELRGTKTDDRYVEMSYEVLSTTPWQEVVTEDATKAPDYRKITVTPYTGYTVQTYRQYVDGNGNPLGEKEKVAYSYYRKRDQQVTVGKPAIVEPEVEEEVTPEPEIEEEVTPEVTPDITPEPEPLSPAEPNLDLETPDILS